MFSRQEDGGKNAFKQQQQKKQEQAQEEVCPVKAIKRILRPASPKELEQLEEKVRYSCHLCFPVLSLLLFDRRLFSQPVTRFT